MPATKKPANAGAPVAPVQSDVDVANQLLATYQQGLKDKMDKRYQALTAALAKETNIAVRYELKVQLEELMTVYGLLFKEV